MKNFIPAYEPIRATNQKKYVMDCLDTNWISSRGKYVELFEDALQKYLNVKHVITTFNGSISLQIILHALEIGHNDHVIVPSLTYAATISAINLVGAKAVLIDSDNYFQMNLDGLEKKITKKTKAVMVPQLYGDAPDMNALVSFCKNNNLYLIEDSAESFGCELNDKKLGSFGIASSFSFYSNKIICCGEGGCIATNDDELATKIRLLKNQSHIGGFIHNGIGYNGRMTNIQAAIGLAQMEDIDTIVSRKKEIAEFYRTNLSNNIGKIVPKVKSTEWMPLMTLPSTINYLKFSSLLRNKLIDTRPAFTPIHLMSGFNVIKRGSLTNSETIYNKGFNLPSYPDLTNEQLKYICQEANIAAEIIE